MFDPHGLVLPSWLDSPRAELSAICSFSMIVRLVVESSWSCGQPWLRQQVPSFRRAWDLVSIIKRGSAKPTKFSPLGFEMEGKGCWYLLCWRMQLATGWPFVALRSQIKLSNSWGNIFRPQCFMSQPTGAGKYNLLKNKPRTGDTLGLSYQPRCLHRIWICTPFWFTMSSTIFLVS